MVLHKHSISKLSTEVARLLTLKIQKGRDRVSTIYGRKLTKKSRFFYCLFSTSIHFWINPIDPADMPGVIFYHNGTLLKKKDNMLGLLERHLVYLGIESYSSTLS